MIVFTFGWLLLPPTWNTHSQFKFNLSDSFTHFHSVSSHSIFTNLSFDFNIFYPNRDVYGSYYDTQGVEDIDNHSNGMEYNFYQCNVKNVIFGSYQSISELNQLCHHYYITNIIASAYTGIIIHKYHFYIDLYQSVDSISSETKDINLFQHWYIGYHSKQQNMLIVFGNHRMRECYGIDDIEFYSIGSYFRSTSTKTIHSKYLRIDLFSLTSPFPLSTSIAMNKICESIVYTFTHRKINRNYHDCYSIPFTAQVQFWDKLKSIQSHLFQSCHLKPPMIYSYEIHEHHLKSIELSYSDSTDSSICSSICNIESYRNHPTHFQNIPHNQSILCIEDILPTLRYCKGNLSGADLLVYYPIEYITISETIYSIFYRGERDVNDMAQLQDFRFVVNLIRSTGFNNQSTFQPILTIQSLLRSILDLPVITSDHNFVQYDRLESIVTESGQIVDLINRIDYSREYKMDGDNMSEIQYMKYYLIESIYYLPTSIPQKSINIFRSYQYLLSLLRYSIIDSFYVYYDQNHKQYDITYSMESILCLSLLSVSTDIMEGLTIALNNHIEDFCDENSELYICIPMNSSTSTNNSTSSSINSGINRNKFIPMEVLFIIILDTLSDIHQYHGNYNNNSSNDNMNELIQSLEYYWNETNRWMSLSKILDIAHTIETIHPMCSAMLFTIISTFCHAMFSDTIDCIRNREDSEENKDTSFNLVTTDQISISSEADAYIFLFVPSEEMMKAKAMISHWKQNCHQKLCPIYMKFFLLTTYSLGNILQNNYSIDQSMIIAMDIIIKYCSAHDIIVILIGMDAILSFPQPASRMMETSYVKGNSLFPALSYGQQAFYGLHSPILIGKGIDQDKEEIEERNSYWNFHSIAGTTEAIIHMIHWIQGDNRFRNSLEQSLLRYIHQHLSNISIDDHHILYNPTLKQQNILLLKSILPTHDNRKDQPKQKLYTPNRMVLKEINRLKQSMLDHEISSLFHSTAYLSLQLLVCLEKNLWSCIIYISTSVIDTVVNFFLDSYSPPSIDRVEGIRLYLCAIPYSTLFPNFIRPLYKLSRHMSSVDGLSDSELDFIGTQISSLLSKTEKLMDSILLLRNFYEQSELACRVISNRLIKHIFAASNAVLASIAYAQGSSKDFFSHASASINPSSYQNIQQRRNQWSNHQLWYQNITSVIESTYNNNNNFDNQDIIRSYPKLHVITMASDKNSNNLKILQICCDIAGIPLTILGSESNEPFNYTTKMKAYYHHLHILDSNFSNILNNDVILLIDAYDVLLYPSVLSSIDKLYRSKTPILFCAEYGIYPEMIGPILYPNNNNWKNIYSPRFLNSGCILGRAQQIRDMFEYVRDYAEEVNDDQQVFVRYAIEYPDLISIDSDHTFFLTGYRTFIGNISIHLSPDLRVNMVYNQQNRLSQSIVGIHFNNMHSYEGVYESEAKKILETIETYYGGSDGMLLLETIRLIEKGRVKEAIELLHHPILFQNRSSVGGNNKVGDILAKRLGIS